MHVLPFTRAYLDHRVGELDELGVGLHVFRSRHRHEFHGIFVAKLGTHAKREKKKVERQVEDWKLSKIVG